MFHSNVVRAAGTLVIAAGLAGCVDASMDIEVLDGETARLTTVMAIERDFYDMGREMENAAGDGESSVEFCEEEDEVVVEEDVVTCSRTIEGTFAEVLAEGVDADEDEPAPTIVAEGNGLVRVIFPTSALVEDLNEEDAGPEAMAMMGTFFEGKFITFKVSGNEIVDTNMTLAKDRSSAMLKLPFDGMLSGEVDVPDEAYAVVRVD